MYFYWIIVILSYDILVEPHSYLFIIIEFLLPTTIRYFSYYFFS
jgi:hypothetical protein